MLIMHGGYRIHMRKTVKSLTNIYKHSCELKEYFVDVIEGLEPDTSAS